MKEFVPELRFPEFGDCYVKRKLKELSTRIGDGLHSTPIYDENGEYYFVNGNNLVNSNIKLETSTKRVNEEEYLKHKKELDDNTVLMSINGTIGNLAYFKKEPIILGKSAAYINVNDSLNKKYLFNNLQSERIRKYFLVSATGSTIKNLGLKAISETKIYLPLLSEQTKIADFLSAVDEQISLLTEKKEKLQTYKRGVMQKLFSQELRFKDEHGEDYPEWEEKKLGEIARIEMGQSPDSASYNVDNIGVPLIQGNADLKDRRVYCRQFTSDPTKLCEVGDIVFTVRAPVGYVAKSNIKACIGRGVAFIRFNGVVEFLFQYLINIENKWDKLSQGSTFTAINGSDLKSFKLDIPSLPEQTKIADFLAAIDGQLEEVEAQIAHTKLFKQGLLQKMFV